MIAAHPQQLGWTVLGFFVLAGAGLLAGCSRSADSPGATRGRDVAPQQRSLLLITIDTIRPDRLEPYGARDVETPNLARLATDGVLFEHAYAVAPITLPSHASILTGLYPPQHGVRNNGINYAEPELETLAEILADEGFQTGAFVSAAVLEKRYGLDQGFSTYDDRLTGGRRPSRRGVANRPAAVVVESAIGWLDGLDQQDRFFAWVHFFDPHLPYEAPESYRGRYGSRPYDAEVAYLDAEIGRLLGHPRIGDDVVIAVVGDHGESLGDHGERTHGILVYDSTLLIPWILRLPGGPAGLRLVEPVSQVDVLPTLVELLGREVPAELPGRSVAPLIQGGGTPAEPALYFESYMGYTTHGWAKLHGLVKGPWKLIQSPQPELFRLDRDPDEVSNLASSEPEILRNMQSDLGRFLSERQAEIAMDEKTAEKLRSLGYLAATRPRQKRDGDRPNPKDMVGISYEMLDFFETEPPPSPTEAVVFLEGVLERDPENLNALRELMAALAQLGRHQEAVAVIERTLELDNRPAPILVLHAQIERRQGHIDRALELTGSALEFDPRLESAWIEQISLLVQTGATAEARRTVEAALEGSPDAPWLNVIHARLVEIADGDFGSAEARLRRALERDPFIVDGYPILADLLEGQNRAKEAVATLEAGLRHYPKDIGLHSRLGMLLARMGRSQEAAVHLARALDLSNSPLPEVEAAIDVLVAQRQGDPAAADTGATTPSGQSDAETSLERAAAYLGAGRLDEAEAELERLLAVSPDNIDALIGMASVQMQRRSAEGFEKYMRRVLQIAPQRADVWSDLGRVLDEQGRTQEAEDCFQRALEIEPGLVQALINLGLLRQHQEQWQQAADYFEQALLQLPGLPELHLELGKLYGGPLALPARARDHYQAFLQASPNDPRAEHVRERLRQLSAG